MCFQGPYLQSMPSEQIRNQLAHMAYALERAVKTIKPREITVYFLLNLIYCLSLTEETCEIITLDRFVWV